MSTDRDREREAIARIVGITPKEVIDLGDVPALPGMDARMSTDEFCTAHGERVAYRAEAGGEG